ncbi:MAG: hypothetical protein HZC36_01340 [Armatimonadetes bacterium]|nr:hypothetical protein [Armatimonadota bacterium]
MLAPKDDPEIPCILGMWFDNRASVYIHPEQWKLVSIRGGVPLRVRCEGQSMTCVAYHMGEHYKVATIDNETSQALGLSPGDYDATARIDWEQAIPEVLRDSLQESERARKRWCSMPVAEIRRMLSSIRAARKPSTSLERQLAAIREINR